MTGGTELHAAEAVDDGGSVPTFPSADAVKLWLSQRFARETDQDQLLRVTGTAVGTFLGAMRVGYGEVDAVGTGLIVPLDWTRDGVPTLAGNHWFDPASEFAGLARSGRTIVVEETDAPPIAGTTTRAFIIVPLIHDGRPVAIFSVADDRPRRWTTEEVTLVSQTGARLWSALQHLRLTEQLRESEEQFRMMAENLPGICWVGDSDAKPLWGNTRWHAMYDETTAAHGDGRGVIHPDDLDRARTIWRDMRVNGVPGEFQLRLRGRDGIYRPFASKATPIRDAVGAVVRWVGVQIDLSDQAAQDRRQAVLRSFADRAREMSDPTAIMTLLAGMLAEHVGVEQFIFVEASHGRLNEGTMYRAIDGAHVTAVEPTLSAAFGAFAVRPDPESTFVATDVKSMADDSPIRISALAMGMRSGINVPLIRRGQQVAGFSCLNRQPRDWLPDDVALCEELAERCWAAVSRARAEVALKNRERAQAFLIDWTDRLRTTADMDAIMATTLEALGTFMGASRVTYSVGDATGRDFAVSGEWRNGVSSIAHTHFSLDWVPDHQLAEWLAGEPLRFDNVAADPRVAATIRRIYDGAEIRAFLTIPLIEEGRALCALSVQQSEPRHWREDEVALVRDVAERAWLAVEKARAEQSLQQRERAQAFLIEWTDRTRELAAVDAIIDTTVTMLAAHLGVTRATYSVSDEAGRLFSIRGEWRDPRVISIADTSFSLDDVGETVEREWLSGAVVRYDDIAVDRRIEDAVRAAYLNTQIAAFVSIPLIENGRVRSALSVQHETARVWQPDELQLLRDVADRTWVAIERARAEAELQERERSQAFLIDWTDRLRGERDPDRIVAITLERLGEHFAVNRTTYSLGDESGNLLINRGEWTNGAVSVAHTVWSLADVDPDVRRQWLAGETIHYDDIPNDPRVADTRRAFFESVSVRSLVTIPMIEGGRVRSALSLQSSAPRLWAEGEIQLLREVAERTWVVLERARAEAELATRERNQAFLIEWSDRIRGEASASAIMDATVEAIGRFLDVSRATFARADGEMFEVVGEWRGEVSSLLGNRFTLPSVGAVVDRDWHAGESVCFADVATDPRLEPAAVERYRANQIGAFLSVPLIAGGAMQSALSVQSATPRAWTEAELQLLRDVAERTWVALERAEAQATLAARARNQAFLVAWSDLVWAEPSARAILSRTVQMLAAHMGVSRVNYSEPDPAFETMSVIEEHSDPDVPSVRGMTYRLDDFGAKLAAAQRDGAPVRIEDTATSPLFDDTNRPLFDEISVRAAMTVSMRRGNETLATLSLQDDKPRRWTDSEVELVSELADRTLAVLERAQSEARLAESEAQLAAFMQNAPIAMYLKDAQGRYVRANPEMGVVLGADIDDALGRTTHDFMPPSVAEDVSRLDRLALEGGVHSTELEIQGRTRYSWAMSVRFPVPTQPGQPKRLGGFVIDLSERRRAEAALAKSREALYQTEKLTALGSLLAGVSHELNNPLSIVVAQAVMMERQSQGTELAERAQKIRKAADRCARIVQSFLAMARQKRPEREAIDLNAIATAAHELADYGLRNDGVRTVRQLATGLPPISADSDQLHQIVINLIVNAQQAMVEAGVEDRVLTLRSALGEAPGTVVLEVADTGPGVPIEVQRRIFEPFYTTKPQGQGTGVGLSFSQGLAEAHGGTLELVPGKGGACFRLTLPIDPGHAEPVAAPQLDLVQPAPARRALVVDDEREIAESLADFLSLEGFTCDIAVGGAAAQQRIAADDFDLIVSDLRMPGLDGPDLFAWAARHRPDLAARIGFATGDTLGQTAARFLSECQRPVLEKPFTPEAVRRFLEQMDLA